MLSSDSSHFTVTFLLLIFSNVCYITCELYIIITNFMLKTNYVQDCHGDVPG